MDENSTMEDDNTRDDIAARLRRVMGEGEPAANAQPQLKATAGKAGGKASPGQKSKADGESRNPAPGSPAAAEAEAGARVTIALPEGLARWFKATAALQGIGVSELYSRACAAFREQSDL